MEILEECYHNTDNPWLREQCEMRMDDYLAQERLATRREQVQGGVVRTG